MTGDGANGFQFRCTMFLGNFVPTGRPESYYEKESILDEILIHFEEFSSVRAESKNVYVFVKL